MSYEDRLRRLNIFSLERRRLRGDPILADDIFHGRLDFFQAGCFEPPAERDLRGHDLKLRHSSFRLLRRKAAFSVSRPISWNNLPMKIVYSPTLDAFKRLLDSARCCRRYNTQTQRKVFQSKAAENNLSSIVFLTPIVRGCFYGYRGASL